MISLIQQPVFADLAAPAAKKASPLETHLDQARSLEEEESVETISASKIAELVIADEYTRMKRSRFSSPKPKRLTTQVKHMQRDNLKKLFVAYGLTEDKVSYDQSTSSRTRSCVEDVRRARD
ncbi:hypothetical protein S40285_10441 [Stachybotrys chlorohalonatus IBT 40285]|uniref:Uncharacterized protein n=1 Tax=Stachybotrys chlorohalonatus (strain IBT 40285) TaxID=1283841 RepID=A0A084QTI6_STAC4|nr:hypothetical protein S40285_10441 [Stachybotrys chlorohalonata IBT 40285]